MRREDPGFEDLAPYAAESGDARRKGRRGASARIESDVPRLWPRRVGEILDVAAEVFRSRFGVYVGISAALWVPVYLLQPLLFPEAEAPVPGTAPSSAFLAGFLTSVLATIVVSVLDNAIVARLVAAQLSGASLTVPAAIRGVLARSFAIGVIACASSVLTGTGCLCFFVGAFLVAWRLYLAPAVCVIEDAGVAESLSRSFALSRGRFFPWLGMVVVSFLLLLPFSGMAAVADRPDVRVWALHQLGIPALAYDCARVGFASLFTGVATAFQGVLVTVWYFDCRARHDGADLAADLERIRASGGGRGSA